jgi:uncharacterized protein YcaQ
LEISVETARKLTLWRQGFRQHPIAEKRHVLETIRDLSCIQIDTVNVVERSHYMTFWSRLGSYEKRWLDELLYPEKKIFEYWAHAASLVPIEHYRYFIYTMKEIRQGLKARAEKWLKEKAWLLDRVLEEIRQNGPMSTSDFKLEEKRPERRTGWWSWSTTKMALEMLFNAGILMVSYRKNFQRYYDLTENVLSSDVDLTEPTEDERIRFFMTRVFYAFGLAKPSDVSSYYYQWSIFTPLKGKAFDRILRDLVSEGVIREVMIEGGRGSYYILTEDLGLIQKIADDDLDSFDEVTFLSPFDNLTWSKTRTRAFFNFVPKFEAYFSQNKRRYGYYNMNILYKDQLVGRIDPKMHRTQRLLEINLLHLEKRFKSDTEFKEKLANAFRDFMNFHNAEKITFRKTIPKTLEIEKYFD